MGAIFRPHNAANQRCLSRETKNQSGGIGYVTGVNGSDSGVCGQSCVHLMWRGYEAGICREYSLIADEAAGHRAASIHKKTVCAVA